MLHRTGFLSATQFYEAYDHALRSHTPICECGRLMAPLYISTCLICNVMPFHGCEND